LHRYVYVGNRPTRYVDPLGLYEWDPTLGGDRTDPQLRESADAGEINRGEAERTIKRRDAFRDSLRKASETAESLPEGSSERRELERSVQAYGEEGKPIRTTRIEPDTPGASAIVVTENVAVGVGELEEGIAGRASAMEPSFDESFRFGVRVTIDTAVIDRGGDQLSTTVAHEGTHASNRAAYQRRGIEQQLGLDRLEGAPDTEALDKTRHQDELEAYRVTHTMLRARRAGKTGNGSTVVWDPGWERLPPRLQERKRDEAINEVLKRPPYRVSPENPGERFSEGR
jgi:hypothetical protein